MSKDIKIGFSGGEQWTPSEKSLVEKAAVAAVTAADLYEEEEEPPSAYEISVLLADDDAVQALNREWRGKDTPTNVLSFPADMPAIPEAPKLMGDIALARETLVRESEEQEKPLAHHLQHLVVHGVLHLFGYDHLEEAEAEDMEAFEVEILAGLGIPNPYEAGQEGGA